MRLPKPFFGAILPQLQYIFDAARSTGHNALGNVMAKSLNLTLTPLYDISNTNVTGLSALMSIEDPDMDKEGILVSLPLAIGNVPTARYNADELQATDAAGRLPLRYVDNDATNERVWMAQRSTQGDVRISFVAYPRNVTRDTPDGPRVDLRRDGGGVNGAGLSFLPSLAEPDRIVKMRVAWDLGNATTDTRGVWTWGDELVVQREGPASDLVTAFYAVGPIKSYISDETPGYGMYWLDEPSRFNATKLAKDVEKLFRNMMPFFDDFGASYRVFIRHAYSYGGTAMRWSFLFEWSENAQFDLLDLLMLMSHEMVHNWPQIDDKPGDSEWSEAWYTEGVANYYEALLPFQFGLISAADFLADVNKVMTAYYTSPARNRTLEDISRDPWADKAALKLHYDLGSTFIARTAGLVRSASKARTSVDDIVRSLLRLRRSGTFAGREEWINLVGAEIGRDKAQEEFEAMASGALIIPTGIPYGPCFSLVREDKYPIDYGFPMAYNTPGGIITELNPNSRAALAGLRVGDRIIRPLSYWIASDAYGSNSTITIERDGEELKVSFWPHAWTMVEAYRFALRRDHFGCLT